MWYIRHGCFHREDYIKLLDLLPMDNSGIILSQKLNLATSCFYAIEKITDSSHEPAELRPAGGMNHFILGEGIDRWIDLQIDPYPLVI
jgi:hypothetical protein